MHHDPATRAFRQWIRHLDPASGIDRAQQITGIGRRSLQRIYSGAAPLRRELALEIAADCTDPVIAAALRAAAQQEPSDA